MKPYNSPPPLQKVLMLVQMYKYPNNDQLGRALFAVANGPLAGAL